jgi:hypothetical protein
VRTIKRQHRAARRLRRYDRDCERLLVEVLGRQALTQLQDEQRRQRRKMLGTVASMLKLFVQEQRADTSSEAIAAMPDQFPAETIAELISELQTSGDYNRIVGGG